MSFFISLAVWTGVSYIVKGIVTNKFGDDMIGWIAGILLFLFGALIICISNVISGLLSYPQDRADRRQEQADFRADIRASIHEINEDDRVNRIISGSEKPNIVYDNRQIHLYGTGAGKRESRLKGMSKFL